MPKFVVKRNLPGITREALASAGARAKTCCAEMTNQGESVRWIRSFFLPESSQTHCYFDAATKAAVEELNKRANLPYVEVSEVLEMTPDSV
jgi:hypothetical protein